MAGGVGRGLIHQCNWDRVWVSQAIANGTTQQMAQWACVQAVDQQLGSEWYLELLERYTMTLSTKLMGGLWWHLVLQPNFNSDWEECCYADIQHDAEAGSPKRHHDTCEQSCLPRPQHLEKWCFHLGSNKPSHQGGNLYNQQISRPWICVKIRALLLRDYQLQVLKGSFWGQIVHIRYRSSPELTL